MNINKFMIPEHVSPDTMQQLAAMGIKPASHKLFKPLQHTQWVTLPKNWQVNMHQGAVPTWTIIDENDSERILVEGIPPAFDGPVTMFEITIY